MNWAELAQKTETLELLEEADVKWLASVDDDPSIQDREVAWNIYIEMRTRVTTQHLHFLDGDEATALKSLYDLFQLSRNLLRENGLSCRFTAAVTEGVLNRIIRPFTSRWHRKHLAGDLHRDDECRSFRTELEVLQRKLRAFEMLMYAVATETLLPPSKTDWSHNAGSDLDSDALAKITEQVLGRSIAYDSLLALKEPMPGAGQASSIVEREQQEIADRRESVGASRGSDDLFGIAVSGGGIRSATFALGVMQGLAEREMFRQVDVVSTVSGGGYLGSFFSSFLNTDSPNCGPQHDREPFKPDIAGDSKAIRYLRNHSRYILPSNFLLWLRTVGLVLYGIVSNLIILSTFVFFAVLLTNYCMPEKLRLINEAVRKDEPYAKVRSLWSLWFTTKLIWGISGGLLFSLPIAQRFGRGHGVGSVVRWFWETSTIVVMAIACVVMALNYIPLIHYLYINVIKLSSTWIPSSEPGWSLSATIFALFNLAGLSAARIEWVRHKAAAHSIARTVLFLLLWLAGPALLTFTYLELCRVYIADPPQIALPLLAGPPVVGLNPEQLLWALLGGSLFYSIFINVNFTSLHRYYRNRLAEGYLLKEQEDGKITNNKTVRLSALRKDKEKSTAPYHLINCALNLPCSSISELRGRDCDFFLFSRHFSGSPVYGYRPTEEWEASDAHLDLGTAMAISGAAAAPQMGRGSVKSASFLLTLLNVRTGYWMHQPTSTGVSSKLKQIATAPGPTYLLREAMNRMSEKDTYLNLSDGGHIENLGMYELLRRRCKFIVAVDGEHDANLDCPSLMRLQEYARVDMDIDFDMDISRLKWVEFTPPDNEVDTAPPETHKFSRGHFTVGRINYPGGETGWLVYIKLSITGNEPDYVQDYRRRNPDFPQQSTADQVYSEDQFEAYRCLGRHVTDDLFSDEILSQRCMKNVQNGCLTVHDWFYDLVKCFFR